MGKTPYKSKELLEYKAKIKTMLLNNEEIVRLLNINRPDGNKLSELELAKNRIIPVQYIQETITSTDCYIMFDLDISVVQSNKAFKMITLYFWILCDFKGYFDKSGEPIPDKISLEIEQMFDDDEFKTSNDKFGINLNLIRNNKLSVAYDIQGRFLEFAVGEWANGKTRG